MSEAFGIILAFTAGYLTKKLVIYLEFRLWKKRWEAYVEKPPKQDHSKMRLIESEILVGDYTPCFNKQQRKPKLRQTPKPDTGDSTSQ
jgi:hypothetical protein